MDCTIATLKRSQLYSEELGIALRQKQDAEYFKWFLASVLFGGRISEMIAKNTFRAFERYALLTPRKIVKAGWDFLVNPIMREGGYVRYDGRKSTQILRNCEMLLSEYQGRLSEVHKRSTDAGDLQRRLLAFYGIGPTTVNIFLRELRPYWIMADPDPLPIVVQLGEQLGLDLDRYKRNSITFARIEAGLIRLRKQLSR
jgi:endonuclease III